MAIILPKQLMQEFVHQLYRKSILFVDDFNRNLRITSFKWIMSKQLHCQWIFNAPFTPHKTYIFMHFLCIFLYYTHFPEVQKDVFQLDNLELRPAGPATHPRAALDHLGVGKHGGDRPPRSAREARVWHGDKKGDVK